MYKEKFDPVLQFDATYRRRAVSYTHLLEEAGRLTDKAEKLVELYKPQMTAAEEIVPLTDLFFEDFPELTAAEKEVMAGETVPTVLETFKAKLEAMSCLLYTSRCV